MFRITRGMQVQHIHFPIPVIGIRGPAGDEDAPAPADAPGDADAPSQEAEPSPAAEPS